ncbi:MULTISPECIES: hypothetical protein [Pseudomonas]|uniref:hypothetical protein n=1 Tax=Pseudomonas TaxID=286 RepID=UPI0006E69F8C|nr:MULTISPECIES: hypothetical protein [Pseudomonas]KPY39645.1 Unknown protein sequence [Pseudomonas savastanoi pv. retacarpa]KUG44437.1 hypothetical protein ALP79_200090 [Pseudomonas savastanoi pv. fraxini]MBA4706412.1 hypothetical protein [Pseudomonas savastanoi pv. savastanoi]MCD5997175.1 hypothetical protein [Pseudomonas californiensis]MCD6002784.1 hypothetical protein [Pseudomonas californiensis]
MKNESKPPMFGPSGIFDTTTYRPRSFKTFWMPLKDGIFKMKAGQAEIACA